MIKNRFLWLAAMLCSCQFTLYSQMNNHVGVEVPSSQYRVNRAYEIVPPMGPHSINHFNASPFNQVVHANRSELRTFIANSARVVRFGWSEELIKNKLMHFNSLDQRLELDVFTTIALVCIKNDPERVAHVIRDLLLVDNFPLLVTIRNYLRDFLMFNSVRCDLIQRLPVNFISLIDICAIDHVVDWLRANLMYAISADASIRDISLAHFSCLIEQIVSYIYLRTKISLNIHQKIAYRSMIDDILKYHPAPVPAIVLSE